MGLRKYKLGELIELCDDRNADNVFTLDDVKGISIKKEFIETKADMAGVSLTPYILVRPDSFAYVTVTSRNGEKITLAHNTSNSTYIVSSSYVVFRVCKPDVLLSDYLFMFFNRPEFDRYSRFNSWGSARETFSWEDFCDIDIALPSIEQQRKYVDVYLSLQNNLATYQSKVDDLKLVCDGYIEDLRKQVKCEKLGKYIKEENVRNIDNSLNNVLGVCKEKTFISTIANMHGIDLHNYKIVKTGWFAYSNRINIGSVALRYGSPCLVSPSYTVFSVDETKLYPEYLSLWLQRDEFLHFAFFYSMGTVKDELGVEDLGEMVIPFPDLQTQLYILDIYKAYIERQRIAAQLKEQLNNLCPILIKGSLQN